MNVIVLGKSGRLGSAVTRFEPKWTALGREDVDVTDPAAVSAKLSKLAPDVVVNCTGFTDVDGAETRVEECWKVNVYGVKNIAAACRDIGARLVHLSSDYAINPTNEYAWTKRASEALVSDIGPAIRTSFYATDAFLVRKLLDGSDAPVGAFTESRYNPISVYGLAKEVIRLAKAKDKGVMHIGTNKSVSPYDFAIALCKTFDIDAKRVVPKAGSPPGARRVKDLSFKPDNDVSLAKDLELFKHEIQG